MGVKDLWQLLAPIGRRVSIETLEGKVLAIDASVWIVQFIKAIRDDSGNMQKNAHIIGTIRRILKLLYHKIKPVFVFDGATPTLKLKTVQARRERKTTYERDQRVVAQRILMSQIKQNMIKAKLSKSILKNISASEPAQPNVYAPSFKPLRDNTSSSSSSSKARVLDEVPDFDNLGEDDEEEVQVVNSIQPIVSSSLSSSSSSVLKQEPPINSQDDVEWEDGYENIQRTSKAKRLSTGENGDGDDNHIAMNSGDDSEDDIDLDLPEDGADLDVSVLASLPYHLRKDVIEAARRKERMKSRSTYIPIADDPAMYSQTQIANFLKTSHLNKKIAKAQKLVDEEEDGGRRIAADGSRKYVFLDKSDPRSRHEAAIALDTLTAKKYPKNAEFDWLDEINSDSDVDGGERKQSMSKTDNGDTTQNKRRCLLKNTAVPSDSYDDNDNDEGGFIPETMQTNSTSTHIPSILSKSTELQKNSTSKRVTFDDSSKAHTHAPEFEHLDDLRETLANSSSDDDEEENSFLAIKTVAATASASSSFETNAQIQSQNNETPIEASTSVSENVDVSDVDWESDEDVPQPIINTESHPMQDGDSKRSVSDAALDKYAQDYIYDDDDDDWEQQLIAVSNTTRNKIHVDLSSPIDVTKSTTATSASHFNTNSPVATSFAIKEELSHSKQGLSEDVARRAVSMASGMADWAGRAVQRALREHVSSSSHKHNSVHNQPSPTVPDSVTTMVEEDIEIITSSAIALDQLQTVTVSKDQESSIVPHDTDSSSSVIDEKSQPSPTSAQVANSPVQIDITTQQLQMTQAVNSMSKEELETALRDEEMYENMARRSRAMNMRDAEGMTDEMRDDVIALLNVFELPYMIAPYEAEAQCAVLEQLGIVDGVVTEDSDAFLFGAKTVYRNIFNDKKFVEVYLSSDASRELGIDREDFVALSFFLGSDYTEGVSGIGIVNSLEILQAFPVKCSRHSAELPMDSDMNEKSGPTMLETPLTGSGSGTATLTVAEVTAAVERGLGEFKEWVQSFEPAEYVNSLLQKRRNQNEEERLKAKEQENMKSKMTSSNADNDAEEEDDDVKPKSTKKRKSKKQQPSTDDKESSKSKSKSISIADIKKEVQSSVSEQNMLFGPALDFDDGDEVDGSTTTDNIDVNDEQFQIKNSKLITFTEKHRSGRMSWKLPGLFPDRRVVEAYLHPAASRDHTPFSWPVPKLHRIRKYCSEMLGWTDGQMDSNIDPVVRRLMEKTYQPRIDSHFMTYQDNSRFAKVASVRLTTAISQITGKTIVPTLPRSPPVKKRKNKQKVSDTTIHEEPANNNSTIEMNIS